jgi:Flp pilus assembly protein TadG
MISRRDTRRTTAERGSAVVPFAIALPVMIGFMGLAIDLAYMYSRHNELQLLADGAALTAALKLDGTKAGVNAAATEALLFTMGSRYDFQRKRLFWSSSALSFAASPEGTWKDASEITDAEAPSIAYAKVDTTDLLATTGEGVGLITTFFPHPLPEGAVHSVSVRAVAGATAVKVTPLAVCALSTIALSTRTHLNVTAPEKIEYGFRRGVSYNLLDLNPNSTTPRAWLVDPVVPGTGTSHSDHFADGVVKHFFCGGTMPLAGLGKDSTVHLRSVGNTPIDRWLNSRFNDTPATSGCDPARAPSDTNIREYVGSANTSWMQGPPNHAYADSVDANSTKRVTYADLVTGDTATQPAGAALPATTPANFGPLWTYSKPVSDSNVPFKLSDWHNLYKFDGVGVPDGNSTAYGSGNGVYADKKHTTSSGTGYVTPNHRRLLNIPLLDCGGGNPAAGAPAKIVGIGRFFMTARASPTSVPGEFAGVLVRGIPTKPVALYK